VSYLSRIFIESALYTSKILNIIIMQNNNVIWCLVWGWNLVSQHKEKQIWGGGGENSLPRKILFTNQNSGKESGEN
jgi:hypothetical protein